MIRSIKTAERAMKLQQTRIDTLANNLANVNSTGFKQILNRVSELSSGNEAQLGPDGQLRADLAKLPREKGSPDNWVQTNPLVMTHVTDNRRGAVRSTGRDSDVAIMGPGFFAVETEAGERYTRAGSFTLNKDKQLVTPDGHPVLTDSGPITIDGKDFSIDNSGNVMVEGALVGRMKIVGFPDPGRLIHEGSNLLPAPEGVEAEPIAPDRIVVAQGHLEGSNVNAIDTLVAMISAQRAFEVQQKTLTTEDEMLSKSVNNLPRVS